MTVNNKYLILTLYIFGGLLFAQSGARIGTNARKEESTKSVAKVVLFVGIDRRGQSGGYCRGGGRGHYEGHANPDGRRRRRSATTGAIACHRYVAMSRNIECLSVTRVRSARDGFFI